MGSPFCGAYFSKIFSMGSLKFTTILGSPLVGAISLKIILAWGQQIIRNILHGVIKSLNKTGVTININYFNKNGVTIINTKNINISGVNIKNTTISGVNLKFTKKSNKCLIFM